MKPKRGVGAPRTQIENSEAEAPSHRLLLRAASQWVFASLQTEPLQASATRALIQHSLALPGWPQMLLQLGVARTTHPTARRSAPEVSSGLT